MTGVAFHRQQPHQSTFPFAQSRILRRLRVGLRTTWRSYRLLVYAALVGVMGGLGAQVFVW
ncbi:MAG TPA: hypothetical protein VIG69_07515, partial [Candidatus Methylomirabilis sp.]